MTHSDGLTIACGESLKTALDRLTTSGEEALIVTNPQGAPLREVSERVLRRMRAAGFSDETPLTALPAGALAAVEETEAPEAAQSAMRAANLRLAAVRAPDGTLKAVVRRDRRDEPILLSPPHVGGEEEELALSAFDTNWIAPLGPNVEQFEKEIAAYLGVKAALALSSGSAGLHLAMALLGVKPGDLVFCSSFTFIASVAPALYQWAEPVFIDSEPESWNMSPAALENAFVAAEREGRKPKAVIVANLYGQSADYEPILKICDAYGVPVVEDAAESLGAHYKGRKSGSLGAFGVVSFNGNKIITTSGGGAIVSDDVEAIARARFLSTQARDPAPHYQHSVYGYNYRMSNILAGVGLGQLRLLERRVAQRRRVFDFYAAALGGVPGVNFMPEAAFGRSNRWLSTLAIDPNLTGGVGAADLMAALAAEKIESRPLWKPMHRQPLFEGKAYFSHGDNASVSDELFEQGLCLPSGTALTEAQLERVVETILKTLRR